MKYLILFLFIFSVSPALSENVTHTVTWESGVNKKVVKEWSISLNKTSDVSSTTYIMKKSGGKDKLHRTGHRDVIIWIPKTTDFQKDFTVVIWFHGHWGYVPKRTFENRTLKQFVPLAKSKNFVLVIPEMPWSIHTPTPTKRNSMLWLKKGDFLDFVNQAENTIFRHAEKVSPDVEEARRRFSKIDYRIVGHSAGGSTIRRLGITGDLCRLAPSMVVWSDSSYGTWLKDSWHGCLKEHPNILVKVFVQKWLSPYNNANKFLANLEVKPPNLELHVKSKGWSHKLIGDNIVNLSNLLGE